MYRLGYFSPLFEGGGFSLKALVFLSLLLFSSPAYLPKFFFSIKKWLNRVGARAIECSIVIDQVFFLRFSDDRSYSEKVALSTISTISISCIN